MQRDGHSFENLGVAGESRTRSIEMSFSSATHGRHEPSLNSTPLRSSLKHTSSCGDFSERTTATTDYSERTTSLSAAEEAAEIDQADSGRAPLKKKRRASWLDEHGLDISTIHHVHDTHYRRGWCKRHRHVLCTMMSLGVSFCLILAAIVAIWGVR